MKKYILLALSILSLCSITIAETHISGDIRASSLDASGNPYIIDQDIVVPAGKHLTIHEGCIFLFKGFTGINVFGEITVSGTTKQPVVFTSINDGDFNQKSEQLPNPFDWNGILIARESSGSSMQNFQLRYSVYGIKSQNADITIQNGVFRQNGQFHFTINDKIQYVQDNISFSYTGGDNAGNITPIGGTGKIDDTKPVTPRKKQKPGMQKLVIRYSSLGVGIIGVAVGTYFLTQWMPKNADITLANGTPAERAQFIQKYSKPGGPDPRSLVDDITKTAKQDALITGIGYGLGALGLIGFTLTFVF